MSDRGYFGLTVPKNYGGLGLSKIEYGILLEELGIDYNIIPVDIMRGQQFNPEFLNISPNNRIPAVIDHGLKAEEPIAIFESGAILLYFAEKHKQLISDQPRLRSLTLQWLFFQVANIGPMLGQCHHFRNYAAEQIPYAINRYVNPSSSCKSSRRLITCA